MNISLSAFAPENLVSRDGFGSPVPRQAESGAYGISPDVCVLVYEEKSERIKIKLLSISTHLSGGNIVKLSGRNIGCARTTHR